MEILPKSGPANKRNHVEQKQILHCILIAGLNREWKKHARREWATGFLEIE